jgi:hypothetical protein
MGPQPDLASAAGIALGTLKNFEGGQSNPIRRVKSAIVRALENEGIEFHQDRRRCLCQLGFEEEKEVGLTIKRNADQTSPSSSVPASPGFADAHRHEHFPLRVRSLSRPPLLFRRAFGGADVSVTLLLWVNWIRGSRLLRQQHQVHYQRVVKFVISVVRMPLSADQHSLRILD